MSFTNRLTPGVKRGLIALGLTLFTVIVVFVAVTDLRSDVWRDLPSALATLPAWRVAAALAAVGVAYAWLGLYDRVALAVAGVRVPWPAVRKTSFLAYALSNNLGFHALTSNAIRVRRYAVYGVDLSAVAKMAVSTSSTMWLGLAAVVGTSLVVDPTIDTLPFSSGVQAALGGILLGAVVAYLVAAKIGVPTLRIGRFELTLPPLRFALAQLLVGIVDWVLTPVVLWILLPPVADLSTVIVAVAIAEVVALASHVPGGIGVLEGTLVHLLGEEVEHAGLLAGVLLFRALYYLLPFLVALTLLLVEQLKAHRAAVVRVMAWLTPLAPFFGALLVFAAGVVLLASGATPALAIRLHLLQSVVPLPVRELSHLSGSVAGLGLLLLAHGLWRRLDSAWWMAELLLLAGALVSILKGFDVEEAAFLSGVAIALLLARDAFDRPGRLLELSGSWFALAVAAVGGMTWLGLFSYRHIQYRDDLWWTFAADADAPRFLRAALVVAVVTCLVGVWRLLSPAAPVLAPMTSKDEADFLGILATHGRETGQYLGLLGDKQVLFDEQRTAFLLYGVTGRTFVALFDPVGPPSGRVAVVAAFRRLVDLHDGVVAFYEVSDMLLPLYLDAGLTLRKFGEEAVVDLSAFSLEGGARKTLRQSHSRAARDGLVFAIVDGEERDALLPELRLVSNDWLASKHTHEKRFSVGAFDEAYLRNFPIAVLRRDGRVAAFANLLMTTNHDELSIDLMRFAKDAPSSTMDALFVEILLWGKAAGFGHFALGMAPLSGLNSGAMSPWWSRAGAFVFRLGEHFYGFRGLRAFKEKFDPTWRPRYVATTSDLSLPAVVGALATLSSGGIRGLLGADGKRHR